MLSNKGALYLVKVLNVKKIEYNKKISSVNSLAFLRNCQKIAKHFTDFWLVETSAAPLIIFFQNSPYVLLGSYCA